MLNAAELHRFQEALFRRSLLLWMQGHKGAAAGEQGGVAFAEQRCGCQGCHGQRPHGTVNPLNPKTQILRRLPPPTPPPPTPKWNFLYMWT